MSSQAKLSFIDTKASVLLDAVRGIAAGVVCLEHWRAFYFVDYGQIQLPHRRAYALPYVLTGAGHQAVIVFFVLSGYLISGSIFRLLQRGKWSWRGYLTHRLVRLWIVLLPALVLGGIFDFVGIHSHVAPALYAGHVSNHMQVNVSAALTVRNFVGSMFFTQGILVHFFGSNGALWSLANEFWYYILFPCGLLAVRRDSSVLTRLVNAVIFVVCAWFAGKAILLLFPVWLLGSALAALRARESRGGVRLLAAAIYIPLFFFIAKTHLVQGAVSDYLLGAATAIFLMTLLGAKSEAPPALWARCSRVTARFSYTLYLVHGPLLGLLAAATVHDTRWQPQGSHIAIAALELALVIAFTFVVGSVTEFRTDKVRGWIESRVLLARERPIELSRSR